LKTENGTSVVGLSECIFVVVLLMVMVAVLAAIVAAATVICLQITVTDTPHKTFCVCVCVVLRKKLKTNFCYEMLASKQFRMLLSSLLLSKHEKSKYTKC
jgi:hypothetical protein